MGLGGRFVFLMLLVALFAVSLSTSTLQLNAPEGMNAPEGTVKTLKDAEYGVLIDCVDIYKQPSLKHPLLTDHVVQLEPSSSFPYSDPERREVEGKSKRVEYPAGQDWSEDEQCPKGSTPIIRTHKRLGEAAPADSLRELRLMYTQLRNSVQKSI